MKTKIPNDPTREAYEAWAEEYGHNIARARANGHYYQQDECNDSWAAWQAALATQPQAPQGAVTGWRPISSAPKDGSTAIIGGADCGTGEGFWSDGKECYGHRGGAGWFWEGDRSRLLIASNAHPTHWQPLPAAPKTETPEGDKQ